MSDVPIYEDFTKVFNRKLDKIINLCEKNAEEINYLHKKIDELSENKSVKRSKLLHHNLITEEDLLLNINNGIFDPELEGKEVILKEGEDDAHIWVIIRVNSDSYDLWYKGSIGEAVWKGLGNDRYWINRYWINNSPTDTAYVRGLCNSYKSKLSSSIQAKLKTGLNANCGSDLVVILSARQLGCTDTDSIDVESDYVRNWAISYFNSDSRRNIGLNYWTSSAHSYDSLGLWYVNSDGSFNYYDYHYNLGVVPAIRVGV